MLGRNSLLITAIGLFAILAASGGASETFFFRYFPRGGAVSGCYARAYPAQHMALHPKQRVTSIGLGYAAEQGGKPSTVLVSLSLTIAGKKKAFAAYADCTDGGQNASCSVESGEGNFLLMPAGQDIKLAVGSRLTLPIAEWHEEHEEKDEGGEILASSPDLAVGGDDRVFLLMPSPNDACTVPPG